MKELEGDEAGAVVDDETLRGYGPFIEDATSVVNCSFGEPLLHPRLDQVLACLSNADRRIELSTNGQAFTPRSLEALAGRPVVLYVSLDAARADTYARLRNDRWADVLSGLLALRDVRRAGNGWPQLNLVFMPMRANRDDIEDYFRLCRLVEADRLVLRPLLALEHSGLTVERAGYRFDYDAELLGQDEIEEVFAACERHAASYRVDVISQFDFGRDDGARFTPGRGAA